MPSLGWNENAKQMVLQKEVSQKKELADLHKSGMKKNSTPSLNQYPKSTISVPNIRLEQLNFLTKTNSSTETLLSVRLEVDFHWSSDQSNSASSTAQ